MRGFTIIRHINLLLTTGNQATGYASQHYSVPVPSRDKLGGFWQTAFSVKWGDDGGRSTESLGGVASRQIVSVSASVICAIKSRRWRAVMWEIDIGCSEFCITVGTATRTAGILIHSWLKPLVVNLSRPSGRLWLYAGFIGSNNPRWLKADFVVGSNPSSSCVWMGEWFFWYQPTRVVPDKGPLNGCVCV